MRSPGFATEGRLIRDEIGIFEEVDRSHKPTAPWVIDIADGAGGWIATDGPLIPVAGDGRGFFMCPCFPRNDPDLTLRVRFRGDPTPHEVTVPNPGFAKTFPTWNADPEPWLKELGEVAVSVRKIGSVQVGSRTEASIELEAHPRNGQLREAWEINWRGWGRPLW